MKLISRFRTLFKAAVPVSNESNPLPTGLEAMLRKRLKVARGIVELSEVDDGALEQAALLLAWSGVLQQLVDGEDLKESVAQMQKLASTARASRRDAASGANGDGISPSTMIRIEEALKLM